MFSQGGEGRLFEYKCALYIYFSLNCFYLIKDRTFAHGSMNSFYLGIRNLIMVSVILRKK